MNDYVQASELAAGDAILAAHSSTTPSVVVSVAEPSHGLAAAHGLIAITVDTYRMHPTPEIGQMFRHTLTLARPDDTFRRVDSEWLALFTD